MPTLIENYLPGLFNVLLTCCWSCDHFDNLACCEDCPVLAEAILDILQLHSSGVLSMFEMMKIRQTTVPSFQCILIRVIHIFQR